MARGRLRIYLGAAPGVGKTFAMLNEGWRGRERGKDVVVGFVETHGRPSTEAQVRDLETIPRRISSYRDQQFEEMDLDAILARRPDVVLVDELAHTNIPDSRNTKRWQDVEELLAAGIDVISTVNIQHLESLNDVVAKITGVVQRERVPDHVVRAADQIELVDMSPESLRRRMAHGNIYRPDKVGAALGNYFRVGNLSALRELALLWVADRVDEGLHDYRERHGIAEPWETKERVVVALTGSPRGERLIRRGARMAARPTGCPARAPSSSTPTDSCSTSWGAATPRSRAPTRPPPWSTSPRRRTPPSCSSAPPSGPASPSWCRARSSTRSSARPTASMSTSCPSPTMSRKAAVVSPACPNGAS
jgi:two-component system sensor histidine kinase KdpD